ncbi:MAG: DNA-binding protein HU [Candidatus Tagabacteria bacterium CG09_land_8_20_14_0_10_41_14]|uniref:DNA-binding protein HU n=2 Tax=Candidatus Tagaibacteriota TaxID=1817918 RepID=A0A2H0WKX6_9BACT|nr:MAG: DNA-binding protein HU [Candidatus Tagabacteria bacterium CG09_land_8_20_14_0_10_41_14]PJE73311.1 MAG: DNA-binding protein HU [Candidatus Tagabacteria bacterium CG10_big_fil_rev_8_21_14_0_10_40_13]
MNKASIVEDLAGKTGISKAEAERIVEGIFSGIIDEVKAGREVSVAGFGIFQPKDRAAREARNPRTGETVQVPAMRVPKFKPAKAFKDAVKG